VAGTTIFFGKNHTCFWGHAPYKKKDRESIFEGIFRFEQIFLKKIGRQKAGMTELRNDRMREQRNEGTTE
jgi:hypothetical protein